MRGLVRSLSSFSWAVSLFGVQQTLRFLRNPPLAAGSFEEVTRAARGSLDGAFLRTFEAGDPIQRSAVDLAFSLASPEAWSANRIAALSSRALQQTTAALGRLLPGGEERW
jgi:hypothetical protein